MRALARMNASPVLPTLCAQRLRDRLPSPLLQPQGACSGSGGTARKLAQPRLVSLPGQRDLSQLLPCFAPDPSCGRTCFVFCANRPPSPNPEPFGART